MELKTYFAQDAAGNIISSAIVNVFLQGTTTLATGLTRADGTPLENPFAADGAGRIQFRAPDGYYDVQVSAGPGIIQTLTIQCVDYSGAKADADRAEAAADRSDVSADQVQNALNSITGINTNFEQNSREQWRRSLAEAGLTLVDGSFEDGATVNSKTDAVWYIAGGQCYTWGGAGTKTVPAKSTPASLGGEGLGKWLRVGDTILRSDLFKASGAGLVGYDDELTYPDNTVGNELTTIGNRVLYASKFGANSGENISSALVALSIKANELKNNFKIIIDVDTAEIFDQTIDPSPSTPYYKHVGGDGLINLFGCSNFSIDFTGSTLKTKSGLRFGAFSPTTGDAYTTQTSDPIYAAHVGRLVYLTSCRNYQIINVNADGNSGNLILGGGWGDVDRQCTHTGTSENNCFNGISINTYCHHFGLDGTYIGGTGTATVSGITHINPVSQYNGRQGLSVTGGDHITLINPDYSYTGRGAVSSSPRAGIDIEPNGSYWSVGINIINPKFINNMGAGFLAINGKAIRVDGGEIISDGACVYIADNPTEVTFTDTNMYGAIRTAKGRNVVFNNVLITDSPRYGVNPGVGAPLIENIGPNTEFRSCKIFSKLNNISVTDGKVYDTNITFHADTPAARTRAAVFRPALGRDIAFIQQYTDSSLVSPSGEHTFVDTGTITGKNWQGISYVSGDGLAIGSRVGAINSVISTVKVPGVYNTGSSTTPVTVNPDTTVDIPLGVGFQRLGITLSGFTNVRFLIEQCSQSSSAADRHQSKIIASITNGLVGTVTSSIIISGGNDVLRLTGVTSDLSAAIATITTDRFVYDGVPLPR